MDAFLVFCVLEKISHFVLYFFTDMWAAGIDFRELPTQSTRRMHVRGAGTDHCGVVFVVALSVDLFSCLQGVQLQANQVVARRLSTVHILIPVHRHFQIVLKPFKLLLVRCVLAQHGDDPVFFCFLAAAFHRALDFVQRVAIH